MYVYMCAWCPKKSEEGGKCPGTGVGNGCELTCGYTRIEPGSSEE